MELKIYYKDNRYKTEDVVKSSYWNIGYGRGQDKKGYFRRVGSWEENFWFMVAEGKTEKITLCNALKRIKAMLKIKNMPLLKYEYIITDPEK